MWDPQFGFKLTGCLLIFKDREFATLIDGLTKSTQLSFAPHYQGLDGGRREWMACEKTYLSTEGITTLSDE